MKLYLKRVSCLLLINFFELIHLIGDPSDETIHFVEKQGKNYVYYIQMKAYPNKILNVRPVKTRTVLNPNECSILCQLNESCQSINVVYNTENNFTCELLDTDQYRKHTYLIEKNEAAHYTMKGPCTANTTICDVTEHINSICIPNNRKESYECKPKVCFDDEFNVQLCCGANLGKKATWKEQSSKVCYSGKSNKFGSFNINHDGFLVGLNLTHISGEIVCGGGFGAENNYWGCKTINDNYLGVLITDDKDKVIFPNPYIKVKGFTFFTLRNFKAFTRNITFSNHGTPICVQNGQQLRVWYGEDLENNSEADNTGQHCIGVIAYFV